MVAWRSSPLSEPGQGIPMMLPNWHPSPVQLLTTISGTPIQPGIKLASSCTVFPSGLLDLVFPFFSFYTILLQCTFFQFPLGGGTRSNLLRSNKLIIKLLTATLLPSGDTLKCPLPCPATITSMATRACAPDQLHRSSLRCFAFLLYLLVF